MMKTKFLDRMRRLGQVDENSSKTVLIGGCGNLGSKVASSLAKLGFGRLILIDDDIVEEENVGYQEYGKSDIGKSKVEALKKRVKEDHPWVKVESLNVHVPAVGDPLITFSNMLKDTEGMIKEAFERTHCCVASFDRTGPRLTFLALSIIYNKPIVFISAWSSGQSHYGAIQVWREGIACPLCYSIYALESRDNIYVAHPFISTFIASYASLIVEYLVRGLDIEPYIKVELHGVSPIKVDYFKLCKPTDECICGMRDKLRSRFESEGLMGVVEEIIERIERIKG